MSAGDPIAHHYLPVFYLKRWAGPDGRVVEFRKWPKSGVVDRWRHPTATGFEPNLYKDQEIKFFRRVDTDAADALAHIEKYGARGTWTHRLRKGWINFVYTLMIRSPDQMAALRKHFAQFATEPSVETRTEYDRRRTPGDPLTPEAYVANRPTEYLQDSPQRLIAQLAGSSDIYDLLERHNWFVVESAPTDADLMTSDCPVRPSRLGRNDAALMLPIGPRSTFWAVAAPWQETVVRRALHGERGPSARDLNIDLVTGAHRLVIAHTTADASLVREYMGKDPVKATFHAAAPKRT